MDNYANDWEKLKNPDKETVIVTFHENGKLYLFSHSKEGKKWYLAELEIPAGFSSGMNFIPKIIKEGSWQRFYEILIPFTENGENYLFAHSSQNNRWFISDLSTGWDGYSEVKNGNWQRFYGSAVSFVEGGGNYLLAHSQTNTRWFLSKLSVAHWDGYSEIRSGTWNYFCETLFVFVKNGRNYLFAHSILYNGWSIARLSSGWNGSSTLKQGQTPLSEMDSLPDFEDK